MIVRGLPGLGCLSGEPLLQKLLLAGREQLFDLVRAALKRLQKPDPLLKIQRGRADIHVRKGRWCVAIPIALNPHR